MTIHLQLSDQHSLGSSVEMRRINKFISKEAEALLLSSSPTSIAGECNY